MSTSSEQRDLDTIGAPSPWAVGLSLFAAVLMLSLGILQILEGIAAIVNDNIFVRTPDYTFAIDVTAWGWIHLIFGVILVLVGVGVMRNAVWARVIGVVFVSLSMFANFLFIPFYPIWSIVLIGLGVAVIWGLTQSID